MTELSSLLKFLYSFQHNTVLLLLLLLIPCHFVLSLAGFRPLNTCTRVLVWSGLVQYDPVALEREEKTTGTDLSGDNKASAKGCWLLYTFTGGLTTSPAARCIHLFGQV